jgi:hypothetical protein
MAKLFAVGAVVALALVASGAAGSRAGARGCPRGALPLTGANPIGPASAAALRREEASARPQVRGATLAIGDTVRGNQVRRECGQRAAARTIVVYVLRRALLPAQSVSQGVYFVSRFPHGYRVWQVAH